MSQRTLRDIRIGVFFGIMAFFIIVLPILKFHVHRAEENLRPQGPPVIYIKEI